MSGYRFINDDDKHLHTLDGQPLFGTSTVVGILNKPLTWWAAGQACEKFGWLNEKKHPAEVVQKALEDGFAKVKSLTIEAYKLLLKEAYYAHNAKMKKSAEAGTDMHAELESYVKHCLSEHGGVPVLAKSEHFAVELFSKWAVENVEKFLFSEGHCFSKVLWLGGITDAGAKMKSGKVAIIDFKSSEAAYYSQFVQEGGYAVQVEENGILDSEGNVILPPFSADELIIVPFRDEKMRPRTITNVAGFKDAFRGALVNHQMNKAFDE